MTQDKAFLQAIVEQPADDTPRLVYADWLEDHDQPKWAELIRVQCELSAMAVFNDHRHALLARQQELLAAHGTELLRQQWPQAANTAIHARTFVRGFVSVLSLYGRNLRTPGVKVLAANPALALVASLDLRNNRIGVAGLRALARSPFLAGLTFLDLGGNPFQEKDLLVLARSAYLPRLQELAISRCSETVRGWFAGGKLRRWDVAVRRSWGIAPSSPE